ncbi:MAG: hypothetical protein AB7K52_03085 [Phycisphaerales bacterium]
MNIVRRAVLPCCLCALAGSATALGQVRAADEFPAGVINQYQVVDWDTPAGTEVVQAVYEIASLSDNAAAGTAFGNGGSTLTFDVGRFPMFPAAQGVPDPVPVSLIAFGWVTSSQQQQTFDYGITFFNTIDTAATAAPFYSGVIAAVRINGITTPAQLPNRQLTQWLQQGIQFNDAQGNPLVIPFPRDADWGYETRILTPGTNDLFPQNTGVQAKTRGGTLAPLTGTSEARRWFDANFDGTIDPNPAATPLEVSGNVATRRDVYLKLRADIPAAPPPGFVDLVPGGTEVDPADSDCNTGSGMTTIDVEVLPGETDFVRFEIPAGVNVDDSTFLDITVDSSVSLALTDMALYNADGNRIAIDADAGANLDPQLSFGHGRRPGTGDAVKLDGRDGDLPPGIYFLAIAGQGAGFGSSSFNVNAADTIDFGTVSVTVTTNVSATANCALPAPIAPDVALDVGLLPQGVASQAPIQPAAGEVLWMTFTTDFTVDAGSPGNFLDIDTLGSEDGTANRGPGLALYDTSGNLIATDSRSGPGANSQLSFRQPGSSAPAVGDGEPYAGQSGSTLPAGTYFLAFGSFDAPPAVLDARSTGWQVRAGTTTSQNVQINFRTSAGDGGCPADFNNDGNVDPDDLGDYINCFFGNAANPGSCPEADFNNDGSADPDDLGDFINIYFTVTGGQPC